MKHYVCTGGCQGVADKAGVCDKEDCLKYGNELTECDCEDGSHEKAFRDEE